MVMKIITIIIVSATQISSNLNPRDTEVDCVNFTVLSSDEISTYSEVEVLNQNNYDPWILRLW